MLDSRTICFNTGMDSKHPTIVYAYRRGKDYSDQRTDTRQSEAYYAYADGTNPIEGLVLEFHEGCHPAEGLNGWLLEDIIAVCLDRVNQHQEGPFRCRENAIVATKLEEALLWMHRRRGVRRVAGTSGTQKV